MDSILRSLLPIVTAVVFFRKALRKRRAKELLFEEEVSSSELDVEGVKKFNHVNNYIALDDVDDFSHQVAGHTKEILRTFKGCILKPMIKRLHFFRELRIYEKMESQGTHWTQSAKAFVSKYNGLIVAKSSAPSSSSSTNFAPRGSSSPRMAWTLKNSDRLFLALEDLTKSFKVPCALDIKMGTQTFEPGASDEKKAREALKCRYQAEVGFRITGFKVYDSFHGTYAGVGKEFGRGLAPDQVTDGLALFFYDGLCLRRDCIVAAIQKLERILLWMKSQRELHFYCSSILIVYDGQLCEPFGDSDTIVNRLNPAPFGPQYSPVHNDESTRHFLYNLPPSYIGRPTYTRGPFKDGFPNSGRGLSRRDSEDTSCLFESYLKGGSNYSSPNKSPRADHKGGNNNSVGGDDANVGHSTAASRASWSQQALQSEKDDLRRTKLVRQRTTQLQLRQQREARLSIPISDLVEVALIDFAHALPGTGGADEGYLHGLKSLISKLRSVLHSCDGVHPSVVSHS